MGTRVGGVGGRGEGGRDLRPDEGGAQWPACVVEAEDAS